MNIKAIIFDWGHTLYDSDIKKELPEAEGILQYLKDKNYRLVLVSLVTKLYTPDQPKEVRTQQIEISPLKKYFEKFLVTDADKDALYDQMVEYLSLPRQQILIIDDRVVRGIRYANQHGHPSIWLQQGKFANELPNDQTGQPTYTVKSLSEIMKIIDKFMA